VADAVERLASKSLVAVDHDRVEPRLRMLEPVRQYAAERLGEAGERDGVVRRHLEWVVALAVEAGSGFMREQRRWSARLRDEQDNVRQAMESALAGVDPEAALRIAASLGYPWWAMGQPGARAWVVRALEAAPGEPELIRGMALFGAGLLAQNALDYDQSLVHLRKALAMSRAAAARVLEGWVLMAMGRAAWAIDVDARPAAAWFEDALRIFGEIDAPVGIGSMLGFLAWDQLKAGDLEGAASRATEAFELGTRSGLLQVVAVSQWVLAIVAARRGEHADAERLLEHVVAAYEQAGERWQLALVLTMTAQLAFDRGDDARALGPLRQALRLARDSGSGERMAYAVELAAYVLHHRGRAREVATLVGAVEAVYLQLPRWGDVEMRPLPLGWPAGVTQLVHGTGFSALGSVVSAGFDEHRVAGRSLSLERAADLTLRVLDEELALAATRTGGGSEAAREVPPAPEGTPSDSAGIFHREGEYWTLAYAGKTFRLRDAKGLHYIAHLLAAPGTEVHVGDLVALGAGANDDVADVPRSVAQGDLGTVLDPRARAEYKRRLDDLRDELAEATGAGDVGRAADASNEIELITKELSAAYGLGGRPRMAGDPVERLRKAVTNQIRRILERIRVGHPALGRHLEKGLRTGVFCSYAPERPVAWLL
jgi:tetratricopeptide (TPR) repeat protein